MENEELFDVSVIVTSKETEQQVKFTRCIQKEKMIELLNQFLSEMAEVKEE